MLQQLDQNPWDLSFERSDRRLSQPVCSHHNNRYPSSCVRRQSTKSALQHQWELLTQLTLNQKGTGLNSGVQSPARARDASTPFDDVLWKANTNAVFPNRWQAFQSPVEVTSEAFGACFDTASKQVTFVPEELANAREELTIEGLSESPVFGKPSFPPPPPNEEDPTTHGQKPQELLPLEDTAAWMFGEKKSTSFTAAFKSSSAGTRSWRLSNKRLSRNERGDAHTEMYCGIPPIGCSINSSDSDSDNFDSEVTSCGSESSSRATNAESRRNDGASHLDEGAVTFRNPIVGTDSSVAPMERTAFATVVPEPARPLSLGSSGFAPPGGSDSSARMADHLFSGESLGGRPLGTSSSSSTTTRKGEDRRQEDRRKRRIIASQPSLNARGEHNRRFSPQSAEHPRGSSASARSASVPTSGVGRMDEHNGKGYDEDVGLEIYHGPSRYSALERKLQHDHGLLGGASVSIPEAMRVSRRCPCAQHSSRMERFARWYHERELQKQKRREAARQKHALTLPEFREAFPSRAEEDAEDASTEPGTASLLRGERVRRVYDECLQNWVPFTERHPELVRSVASLMRRERNGKSRWRSGSFLSKSSPTSGLSDGRRRIAGQRSGIVPPRSALADSARSPRFPMSPHTNKFGSLRDARRPEAFNGGGEFSKWGPSQHVGQSGPASRGIDRDYGVGETSGMTVDELQRHGFGGPFPGAESQGAVTGPAGFLRAATVHPEPPVVAGGWPSPHNVAVPAGSTPHNVQPYAGYYWGSACPLPGRAWEGAAGLSQVQVRGRAKLWDPGCPSQLVSGPSFGVHAPDLRSNLQSGNNTLMFGPAGVVREHWPTSGAAQWVCGSPGPLVTPEVGCQDLRYRESGTDENRSTSMPGRELELGEQRTPQRGAVQFRLVEADGVPDNKRRPLKQSGGRGLPENHLVSAPSHSKRAVRGETRGRRTERSAQKVSAVRRSAEASRTTSQKGTGPREPLSNLWRSTYPAASKTQAAQLRSAAEPERKAPFVAVDKPERLRSTQKVRSEESRGRNDRAVCSPQREIQPSAAQVVSPGKAASHPTDSLARAPSFELSLIQDSSEASLKKQHEDSRIAAIASDTENSVPTFGDGRRPREAERTTACPSAEEPVAFPPWPETRREDEPGASLVAPPLVPQDYIVTPIDGSHTSYLLRAKPGNCNSPFPKTATHLQWEGDEVTVTTARPSSSPSLPAPARPASPVVKDLVFVEHLHPGQEPTAKPAPSVGREVAESVATCRADQIGPVGPASEVLKPVTVVAPLLSREEATVTDNRGGGAQSLAVGASTGLRARAETSMPHVTVLPAGGSYGPNVVEVRASARGSSFRTNGGVEKGNTMEPSAWLQEDGGARVAGEERVRVCGVSRAPSGGFLRRPKQQFTGVLEPQRSLPSIGAPQCRVVTPRVSVAEPLFESSTGTSQQAILVPLACPNVPIFSARRRRSLSPFGVRGNRRVNS